jgi:hypothetical protein
VSSMSRSIVRLMMSSPEAENAAMDNTCRGQVINTQANFSRTIYVLLWSRICLCLQLVQIVNLIRDGMWYSLYKRVKLGISDRGSDCPPSHLRP